MYNGVMCEADTHSDDCCYADDARMVEVYKPSEEAGVSLDLGQNGTSLSSAHCSLPLATGCQQVLGTLATFWLTDLDLFGTSRG